MAGRNDVAIAADLEVMAHAMENQLNVSENAGSRSLDTFQRENSPVFKAKVADDWWLETCQRLKVGSEEVTWAMFRREFPRKYFPEDVRGKKEIEFLKLIQGSMSITACAANFGELAKFYKLYDGPNREFSKCIKFENELRPKIKKAISYQKIRVFVDLVDSCRIYEEDSTTHYKMISEKRNKSHQNRGKPYDTSAGKGKQKSAQGQRTSGGDAPAGIVCFKCGKPGHKSNVCTGEAKRCFHCGKAGHEITDCNFKTIVCFNCGEEEHVNTQCKNPKKAQAGGKVFALAETQTSSNDRLIRA
ncbi:uncharacterized protein LOC131613538 [Vicia villosa]|uniref:uncharacterized protein LOC131613538 n=1 Tax=Vicia villosa TaxID=3911 RepID=UPI00273C2D8B|nr:uncharacterized protein LOC131613538 [Vicia villosa]